MCCKEGLVSASVVTEEMREAGRDVAEALTDVSIALTLGGMQGINTWDEYASEYSGDNLDLLKLYASNEINAVTAIYVAMHRKAIQ